MLEVPRPEVPVFLGGGARPNARFQALCALAGIKPRLDIQTGEEEPWELKDLRKTCATYYDEHVPESSVEILGHPVGGITYRHYAHRAPVVATRRPVLEVPHWCRQRADRALDIRRTCYPAPRLLKTRFRAQARQ